MFSVLHFALINGNINAKDAVRSLPDYIDEFKSSHEFAHIRDFYGAQTTKRSGVPLINHIIEGIAILVTLGASAHTIGAYCLHPIVQGEVDKGEWDCSWSPSYDLAKEYRDVANTYLCREDTDHIHTIDDLHDHLERNSIEDVSVECIQMLFADKYQNREDFREHHKDHVRAKQLTAYFDLWIAFTLDYMLYYTYDILGKTIPYHLEDYKKVKAIIWGNSNA